MKAVVLALAFLTVACAQSPPPLGRLVDVGGYRVHLNCTGEGSPTVMIVGAGFSFDWALVQPEVARFTRVCTYDPSGLAWSDPGPGATCPQRVAEIHQLLKSAEIEGPYVLTGLSVGALITRYYAHQFPAEVAGMVIVDHAFLNPVDDPPKRTTIAAPGLDSPPVLIHQEPIVFTVEDISNFNNLPERSRQLHRWAMSLHPVLPTFETATKCSAEAEAAETRPDPLGDLPLVVVSTANDSPNYPKLQAKLLKLSHNSKQLIASRSFHAVEIDQPEVVVRAIRQVVDAARDHSRLH
ncbi:MAG TPA: alpha/beta hydrolase [Bryobacteraceae bacterium]|nr:alpha/beta hydrolase [Bryobacteraceae bacterium]